MKSKTTIFTYKNKTLLFSWSKDPNSTETIVWSFVPEKTISTILSKKIHPVQLNENLYHMKLTDDHVNNLVRKEEYRLEFYKLNEINKLSLSEESLQTLESNREDIEKILK